VVKKAFSMEDRRAKLLKEYGSNLLGAHEKLTNMHDSIMNNVGESAKCVAFLNIAINECQRGLFDNLKMTESVDLVIRSVITTNVMALSRAWDTDSDVPSIPNAAALLVTHGYESYGRDDQEEEVLKHIRSQREDIYNKVRGIAEGDLLRRFKLHRNNYIAHSLPQKTKTETDLYIDEDMELCAMSIEIAEMISHELNRTTRSLHDTHKWAKRYGQAFWSCLSSGQRT
jgi:hypothetical protein